MTAFPLFDRSRLLIRPLAERTHSFSADSLLPLRPAAGRARVWGEVAARLRRARRRGAAVVLMLGAHVLRSGVQRYLIDWLEQGWVSCVALNGACVIHDYELALAGATTESVSRYIATGQFGLWRETGELNRIVARGARAGLGLGESVGREIERRRLPRREISLLAAAFRCGVPATVHVGIGYDIVYEHPNCDGAAWGAASYRDFLRYTRVLENLEGGAVLSFGSAVMAPEIYLKALAMARNVAHQERRVIRHFTTLVCDLHQLPASFRREPPRNNAAYYFRPWKTLLVRTVADGGKSYYVRGPHALTIPRLWTALRTARPVPARPRQSGDPRA